jgi:hypothetical protein
MQDLINSFDLIITKQHITIMEHMVDHIHIDNNIVSILFR